MFQTTNQNNNNRYPLVDNIYIYIINNNNRYPLTGNETRSIKLSVAENYSVLLSTPQDSPSTDGTDVLPHLPLVSCERNTFIPRSNGEITNRDTRPGNLT